MRSFECWVADAPSYPVDTTFAEPKGLGAPGRRVIKFIAGPRCVAHLSACGRQVQRSGMLFNADIIGGAYWDGLFIVPARTEDAARPGG